MEPGPVPQAPSPRQRVSVLVRQARWEAEDVLSLQLESRSEAPLPEWTPGAHIDVVLPSGRIRPYSLCGDPKDRQAYRIAVLKEEGGLGGSRELHETQLVGKTLDLLPPRNHFPLVDEAQAHLLIAGGIGITPILAMARHLESIGADWQAIYTARTVSRSAFAHELVSISPCRVTLAASAETGRPDIPAILTQTPPTTVVYCCGPAALISSVSRACGTTHRLEVERFEAAPPDEQQTPAAPSPADAGERVVDVTLERTGCTLQVPATRTILEVIRERIPDVPFSCEEGYCGTCETGVLEGTPDHRDTVLSEAERASGQSMMTCVSRALSDKLVLDL